MFTRVASERAALLERRDDVHRRLVDIVLAGGGLSEVVATIGELFAGLAMVTTVDGRVLATSGDSDRAAVHASSVFHPSGRFRTERSTPGLHEVADLPGSHAVLPVAAGGSTTAAWWCSPRTAPSRPGTSPCWNGPRRWPRSA